LLTHPVDGVSDGEQFKAEFQFLLASFFLHDGDDECAVAVAVAVVRINHVHAVLRVRPERVCNRLKCTRLFGAVVASFVAHERS